MAKAATTVTGGVVFFIILFVAAAVFLSAFIGMVVIGAFAGQSEWFNYAPGYWETFFGLWSLGIVGGAWNGIKLRGDK